MYVLVDDLWKQLAPLFHRPGPAPRCSDAELLPLALDGERRSWDLETELLAHFRDYRHLFPMQPTGFAAKLGEIVIWRTWVAAHFH